MTRREHIQRHKELHRALDELLADWIACDLSSSGKMRMPSNHTILDLMKWSCKQTQNPDEDNTRGGKFFHALKRRAGKTPGRRIIK